MPTAAFYDIREMCKHALNAINASDLADAEILSLTTTAQLIALFDQRATGHFDQRKDMQFHKQSITAACASGDIFTNANIAAADTVAGLRAVITTAATTAGITLGSTYNSGNRAWL
jgi:hypothetical protein